MNKKYTFRSFVTAGLKAWVSLTAMAMLVHVPIVPAASVYDVWVSSAKIGTGLMVVVSIAAIVSGIWQHRTSGR